MPRIAIPLEKVSVASPCTASWDAMTGDDRVRFCGQCQKHVYNLSEMQRDEAEALVQSVEGRLRVGCHDGRLCIRYYRRADGTLLTADCPVGLKAARRRLKLLAGSAVGSVVLMVGAALTGIGLLRTSQTGERRLDGMFMEWLNPPPPPPSVYVMGELGCLPAVAPPGQTELDEPVQSLPARRP